MTAVETGHPYELAFETSSAVGRIGIGRSGAVLAVREFSGPRRHAREFLATVDSLCREHGAAPGDIQRVFVSIGPGSFTGLRIGVTAARMMAMACGAQLVAVPTLEVIAQNAALAQPRPTRAVVLLDAKRARVFSAAFRWDGERFRAQSAPAELEPAAFLAEQDAECVVLGEGVAYHREAVDRSGLRIVPEELWPPRADTVYRLGRERAARGEFTDRRSLVPLYIRPPEAEEKWAAARQK